MLNLRILSAAFFIFSGLLLNSAWALEDDHNRKTISGTVEDIDWLKSIITVRYYDADTSSSDELDIIIPGDVKIKCGASELSFPDIEQSDPVTVTYYNDGVSGLKAVRVSDLNDAKRGIE